MQLMKSKDGGFTYVYSITDVERLEGYGWRKADPSEQVKQPKVVAPTVVTQGVAEPERFVPVGEQPTSPPPKKKPGRPFKAK
jgi:hypothetical protein